MSFSIIKSATLSAVLFAAASVPAVAADADKIADWAQEVREEFVSKQRYPKQALRANEEGTVKVRVRVTAAGAVNGFEIVETSGSNTLDAAALDTIARIRTLPAVPTGKEHAFVLPLSFQIEGEKVEAQAVEATPVQTAMGSWRKSVERLVASRNAYPQELLNEGVEGRVKVRLDLAADGTVVDSQVVQSSGNQKLDDEALLMAANLDLPTLPAGKDAFSVVLPLKYEIQDGLHTLVRR